MPAIKMMAAAAAPTISRKSNQSFKPLMRARLRTAILASIFIVYHKLLIEKQYVKELSS
jgi:hypothetical protein